MIEIIYKDEKREKTGDEALFPIPKNIRQIGEPGENFRIYMEDYVYTFLGKISRIHPARGEEQGALAVLTGETRWQDGTACIFVRGALLVTGNRPAPDHFDFSEEVWAKIHEEGKKYFSGQEVVGWFFSWPQQPMKVSEFMLRTHLKNFGGEKTLFLMEPTEREECFFRYENSEMMPVRGYYIYYEKNQPMQEYMLDKKDEIPAETAENVDDQAVKAFRKIIKGKKTEEEPEEESGHSSVFSYAAAACLVLAVAAVGMSVYRNYQKLQEMDSQPVSSVELTAVTGFAATPTPVAGTASILDAIVLETTTEAAEETTSAEEGKIEAAEETTSAEAATLVTESAEMPTGGKDASDTVSAAETSQIFLEESDTRKAKRREAQSAGSSASQSETGSISAETDTAQTASVDAAHTMYIIQPGDTLYKISLARYGTIDLVSEICSLNNLSENQLIYPGQVIVLP